MIHDHSWYLQSAFLGDARTKRTKQSVHDLETFISKLRDHISVYIYEQN